MKILNAHHVGTKVPNAVYCGRPSKWGNPFVRGKDGPDRETVVGKYAVWICDQPNLLNSLHEINGKDLICWCAPKFCHTEILRELCLMYFGEV